MSAANPLTTALDTATTRMKDFERQQSSLPANPAMQMQLPGVGRIGFRGPETEEEKSQRSYDEAMRVEQGKRTLNAQDEQAKSRSNAERVRATASLLKKTYRTSDGKPLSDEAAQYAAESGKTPIELGLVEKPMSEAERKNLGATWARINIDQQRAKDSGGSVPPTDRFSQDFTPTLNKISDFLPTTDPKTGELVAPKRALSGAKSFLVSEGEPGGSFIGRAALFGASQAGVDTSEEQIYATLAREVATAYAMREQQGRNVSNADLANRKAQVSMLPNEIGNLEIQKVKGDRLRQWATALSSGVEIPQVRPGETASAPKVPMTISGGFPSYEEWAKSRKR
jgi:hypothetical protein